MTARFGALRRFVWPFIAVVVVVALAGAILPTRTYLQQRDEIAAEEAKIRVLTRENAKLSARVQELHTDAEVERLAREQYNLVRPGEEAYAILPGPADTVTTPAPPEPAAPPEPSWWRSTLDTLSFWN